VAVAEEVVEAAEAEEVAVEAEVGWIERAELEAAEPVP
jgi:fructose/tagatose bisphosphate aldolase